MLFFKNLPEELRHEIVLFFRDPYGEEKRKLMEEIRFYGILRLFVCIEDTYLFRRFFNNTQGPTIFKTNYRKRKKKILDLCVLPHFHRAFVTEEIIFNRRYLKNELPLGFIVKLRVCLLEYFSSNHQPQYHTNLQLREE